MKKKSNVIRTKKFIQPDHNTPIVAILQMHINNMEITYGKNAVKNTLKLMGYVKPTPKTKKKAA